MSTESDVKDLERDLKKLAGAVESLATVVEGMAKGTPKPTAASEASWAAHTARGLT